MWRAVSAVVALLTAGLIYFVNLVYAKRRELDGLPQPPMESRFWGHLKIAGDCKKLFPPNCHMQNWPNYIRKKYDLGDVFYVDWWPLGPRWLFVADPELASKYVTTTQSLPKSSLILPYLNRLLGANNMVGLDGPPWKSLRSMFNPGFSASHLMTLIPVIVDSGTLFRDLLLERARTQELFHFDSLAINFTLDIIGKVVMDVDFDAQRTGHPIVTTFRRQVELMPSAASIGPLDDINFVRPIRLWLNMRKLDALLGAELDVKIAARANSQVTKEKKDRKRSVVDLALDAYEKEVAASPKSGGGPTTSFRTSAIDSIKTFIFAGHDTTSATLSYVMYLLHLHPHVHKKLVAELDDVFGAGASSDSMADAIKAEPHLINKLEYLNAVIKEVLRLFPPASTIRELTPSAAGRVKETFVVDPATGKPLPMAGFHLWPVGHMIHRNEAYFPEPTRFIPERFLVAQTPFPHCKLHTPAGKDAWRPFEKGPRNCIGQELAMMEAKVVLALVVREVDFAAEFDGVPVETWDSLETRDEFADGRPGSERLTVEGHRPYQMLMGAARPCGGMEGRLRLRR